MADTGFKYKDFTYNKDKPTEYKTKKYTPSDAVTDAKNALDAQLKTKPGYTSKWQDQLDDAINKILNREKFSYDFNGDALYQQYKDKYIQQGKMASADVMGHAAAMTGGYGNSYAASVGNQAYQQSLQQLNDIVPELYQMAYDRYNQEGQDLYNQYAILGDRENMDYGRYRDSVADWQTERDYLTGRYDSERNFDYGKYTDDRNFEYGKHRDSVTDWQNDRNFEYGKYADDKSYAYNDYRNKIEDAQWQANFDEAIRQYNEQFAYQKDRDAVADSQWQKQYDESVRQHNNSNTSSSGGYTGGGGSSGGSSGGNSGGNSGASNNTGNSGSGNANTSVPDSIKNKAASFTDNDALDDYLTKQYQAGKITKEQMGELYIENEVPSLKNRNWTLVDNGGVNWLWGIDNNATGKDQYGKTYRLDKLVDALVAEGMSKSDAKAYVKKLQKELGA